MKSLQRKNKHQMIREHLQRKQHPNRQYSHRSCCPKERNTTDNFLEAIAYLFQFAIFVGLGILIYKMI